MAQIFTRTANTTARVSIAIGLLALVGLTATLVAIYLSPYVTEVGVAKQQPVPFSHQHHVRELAIDCRYCHATVESQAFAGIPSTDTCMSCHSQIWTNSPLLQPVRDSLVTGQPVLWNRIYDLPDFVFFNHSIHVDKGVGCSSCHGQVDQMQLTYKAQPLYMGWCLGCHREPERYIRPREEVFNMAWQPPPDQIAQGQALVQEYQIKSVEALTACYTCHR
jgi:hypothetical protein